MGVDKMQNIYSPEAVLYMAPTDQNTSKVCFLNLQKIIHYQVSEAQDIFVIMLRELTGTIKLLS